MEIPIGGIILKLEKKKKRYNLLFKEQVGTFSYASANVQHKKKKKMLQPKNKKHKNFLEKIKKR